MATSIRLLSISLLLFCSHSHAEDVPDAIPTKSALIEAGKGARIAAIAAAEAKIKDFKSGKTKVARADTVRATSNRSNSSLLPLRSFRIKSPRWPSRSEALGVSTTAVLCSK